MKIVRISAECGNIRFRSKHQADVGIALVLIEKVLATLIEVDGLALEFAEFRFGAGLLACLFKRSQQLFACVIRCRSAES